MDRKIKFTLKVEISIGLTALFCQIISTGGIYWQHDKTTNQGLWKKCSNGNCGNLTDVSSGLYVCRGLLLSSSCIAALAVIILKFTLLLPQRRNTIPSTMLFTAFVLSLTALLLYTFQEANRTSSDFGWSYVLAWISTALLAIDGVCICILQAKLQVVKKKKTLEKVDVV